jgi:O-antigen/teichoic acid export membrane protein
MEAALGAHLASTVIPFCWILPPALGLLAILAGPAVAHLLPEYTAAIPATRILIFLGLTTGLERLVTVGLVAAERQAVLPWFSAAALGLNATLAFLALRFGYGLYGVAAAALASNAAYGLAKLAFLARLAGESRSGRILVEVLVPLLWSVGIVLLVSHLRPGYGVAPSAISAGLFFLAVLPLVPKGFSELRKIQRSLEKATPDSP